MRDREGNAAAGTRHAWVDVAKAACILLVVLFHAYDGEYRWLNWQAAFPAAHYWGVLNEALKSVRMPLFFLVSGLLATRSLDRPWREVAHKRVYNLVFLYLLWAVILSLFFSVLRAVTGGMDEPVAEKLVFLLLGVSWAWYLGALPAFFLFARATRSLPLWMPLALAYGLAVAADAAGDLLPWSTATMMRSLLFFVAGTRLPGLISGVAASARPWMVVMPALALTAVVPSLALGMAPVVNGLAVWIGILVAAIAARSDAVRRAGAWLGARTLPIYILHFPVLAILGHFARIAVRGRLDSSIAAALFPLALAAAAVPISLALHRLILTLGGNWLFALPDLRLRRFRGAAVPS